MRVLIFLSLLGAALAVPKTIQKIVGGTPTAVEQYPYMSNMQYAFSGYLWTQACGGALITSTAVLSAAHCYIGDLASEWRVRLGTSFASTGGTIHYVSQLVLHPQYNNNMLVNDVAIVRLSTPAVYSASIQPASIAGSTYSLADNTDVVIVGWGSFSSGGFYPERLQHITIKTINQGVCAERYAYLKSQPGNAGWSDITNDMLCAGILDVGGKDACQGDSGGPLVHNGNVIVGIVSWGYGCADSYYPGVYSRISANSNWIAANVVS